MPIKNLVTYIGFADDSGQYLDYKDTKELIHDLYTNDFAAPPTHLTLITFTKEGHRVAIRIPYGGDEIYPTVEIDFVKNAPK